MEVTGKILLFGEYTILHGGKGLAIPLFGKNMSWEYNPKTSLQQESHETLHSYLKYLSSHKFLIKFDLLQFSKDLKENIYLESNIPRGYGAGSSGAFCASILHRYGQDASSLDIIQLRALLIKMEGYFHGQSSGIDPLVSYLNDGVVIKDDDIFTFNINSIKIEAFSLIDTNITRSTAQLVAVFNDKMLNKTFQKAFAKTLQINNKCIDSIVAKDTNLTPLLKELSQLQLDHFQEMIPDNYLEDWQNGLDSDEYYYKLCGAGGGGYILMYTT